MDEIAKIGFDDWFLKQLNNEKLSNIARVTSVHKYSYTINNGSSETLAKLSGNLRHTATSALALPTAGDWVVIKYDAGKNETKIISLIPRKSLLKRKAVGKSGNFQLIGANIDTAFIIQSVNDNLNLRRLERYLVMVNEGKITPIILLSKTDLISEEELQQIIKDISTIAPKTEILPFSNKSGNNTDTIINSLKPRKTYCLIGSSGVGKTTLLNNLVGHQKFQTQDVSKKESKGRHTTTSRELIQLENDALIIDTPGMRELGTISSGSGLKETFSDIMDLAHYCQFSNCSHTGEKGCAVIEAIGTGELPKQRFENYIKMKMESEHFLSSTTKRRKKDKDFGKMNQSTTKGKIRR